MSHGSQLPARLRVTYDPEADALYLELRDGVAVDNVDLAPGVTADLDRRGRVLGIEVLPSSRHLRPFLAGLAPHPRGPGCDDRDREFRRLRARLASAAGRAGITPDDMDRESAAYRAGRL